MFWVGTKVNNNQKIFSIKIMHLHISRKSSCTSCGKLSSKNSGAEHFHLRSMRQPSQYGENELSRTSLACIMVSSILKYGYLIFCQNMLSYVTKTQQKPIGKIYSFMKPYLVQLSGGPSNSIHFWVI